MDDILNIFMFLDVKDVIECSYVNKLFNMVSKNQLLWKRLNDNCYPQTKVFYENCHKTFKMCHEIKKMCYLSGMTIDNTYNTNNLNLKIFRMRALPLSLLHFPNLKILDIGHTLIKIFDGLEHLTNLKKLYLTNCQIKIFPEQIFKLHNLDKLHIGFNKLKTIPTEIGKMKNLEILYFDWNSLKIIPTEICKLTKLKCLSVTHNKIKELPQEISNLINLEELYAWSNVPNLKIPYISNLKNRV